MLSKNFKKIFLEDKRQFPSILGQDATKQQLMSALLTDRHIVVVGPPGIGKTTLAKDIADILPETTVNNCEFHCDPKEPFCPECKTKKAKTKKIKGIERFVRIQGSPDLTAEDLLGDIDPIKALKFGPLSLEAFTPGKIFKANKGVLFFDEVNRCPEKLQNALLQVLQERKATIGSYDIDIPTDFIFIGTMNPQDSSAEKLSEVFLDRFDIIYMDYPETLNIEKQITLEKSKQLEIRFPEPLLNLAIYFIRTLRQDKNIEKKPSVRATIGLYERAQSNAFLKKQKQVTFEDIKEAIISVLSHRIELKPSIKYLQNPIEYIEEEFKKTAEEHKQGKISKTIDKESKAEKGGGP